MGSFHPEDAPALRFAAEIGEKLHSVFACSALPIVGVDDSAIRQKGKIMVVTGDRIVSQRGTGTLVRVKDHHFLVTASHVCREIERLGEDPSICCDDPPAVSSLVGHLHCTDEVLDLAILTLEDKLVAQLAPERFLALANVEFRPDLGGGWYFLHGYPYLTSYTSKDLLTTLQTDFTYRTGLYAGRTTGFRNYDPQYHILLAMDGEQRCADDGSPAKMLASLGGISGSSVWLGFSERHYMDEWTPDLARVVAVQTKVYTDRRVVQATRWAGVALVLWKNYPELQDELVAHLPRDLVCQFSSE